MSDLAVIFKDMLSARKMTAEARLSRKEFLHEKKRADNLQENFNQKLKVMDPVQKNAVLNELIAEELLPAFCGRVRDIFNGTFDSEGMEYRAIAKDVVGRIPAALINKNDQYEWCANELKVLGIKDMEFSETMAQIGKILK